MDRFTWGFVVGAIVLCVLAIGGVFLARVTPPPLSTPAGVVTAFVQAVRNRDADRAWNLLAPDAIVGSVLPVSPGASAAATLAAESGTTPRDDFRRQLADMPQDGSGMRRIRILDTTENGESARVNVEVTTVGGSPLFGEDFNQTLTFSLKQVDGAWRIDTSPSLYEIG